MSSSQTNLISDNKIHIGGGECLPRGTHSHMHSHKHSHRVWRVQLQGTASLVAKPEIVHDISLPCIVITVDI